VPSPAPVTVIFMLNPPVSVESADCGVVQRDSLDTGAMIGIRSFEINSLS
jgi:hypothetical protein